MQAGYRTDPVFRAKALKASIKNKKLDNALYGSDVKLSTELNSLSTSTIPPTNTSGSDKPSNLPSATAPASAVTSVVSSKKTLPLESISDKTLLSIPEAKKIVIGKDFASQLLNTIKLGIKPSDVKKSQQKTSATTADNTQLSDQKIEEKIAKMPVPKVEIPTAEPLKITPINTEATPLETSPDQDIENKSSVQDTYQNSDLQSLARDVLNDLAPSQNSMKSIDLYDKNRKLIDGKSLRIMRRGLDKNSSIVTFEIYNKIIGPTGKPTYSKNKDEPPIIKLSDTPYDLYHSLESAYSQKEGSSIKGKGLERAGSKVTFKHRRTDANKGDHYVLIAPYLKGNIKLFTSLKRPSEVSYNNASPAFLQIVKDIVERGTFEGSDYKNLKSEESRAANEFIRITKPLIPNNVVLHLANTSDIYELRKRYQVLVGELAAGNHGKLIKEEMIGILRDLQRLKAISIAKVDQLIKGLKEL